MFWLVDTQAITFANRSYVKYEFTNTKKLARKEASYIFRQQFANVFYDCFCAVHTHQLEFANTSLPTLVCLVKTAKQHNGDGHYSLRVAVHTPRGNTGERERLRSYCDVTLLHENM